MPIGTSKRASCGAAIAVLATGVLLEGCGLTAQVPTVTLSSATLAKCQAKLETATTALDNQLRAALRQCVDLYRKSTITNMPPIATAATKCNTALTKALTFPDPTFKSGTAKAVKQIGTALTTNACTAKDLVALGHLPPGASSIDPAELIVAQRIKAALQNQVQLVRDAPGIFATLETNGCTTCGAVKGPPCVTRSCTLSSSSFAAGGIPISGGIALEVCDLPGIPQNAFAVYAEPQGTLTTPASIPLMVAQSCTKIVGAEGFISKSAAVSVAPALLCQDHLVQSPETDECPASTICTDTAADPIIVGATNGGICLGFGAPVGTAGASAMMVAAEIRVTSSVGTDTLPCTADDPPASANDQAVLPLLFSTAANVSGQLLDRDGVDATTATATQSGTAFDPVTAAEGILSGGKWVGAFPAIRAGSGSDLVVDMVLECD